MKNLAHFLVFTLLFTMMPKNSANAGFDQPPKQVISTIEEKYKELEEEAPYVHARGKAVARNIRFIQPEDKVIKDYSKLKQIALVRHGEPDMDKSGKFSARQAQEYQVCYDSVCIIVPDKQFFTLQPDEDVKVYSSPLNRALTTAQYLCGTNKDITVSPDFREFEMKIETHDSKVKLPIKFWKGYSRVKWMLGRNKSDIECFSDAKKRAKRAAYELAAAAKHNPKVLLTAHGMLNRYIKKELKKLGWEVVEDTGNGYFGTTILVKIEK